MVIRAKSFAALAFVATPFAAAAATTAPVNTPTFDCSAGSVKWDDGVTFSPGLRFGLSGKEFPASAPFSPMTCEAKLDRFEESLNQFLKPDVPATFFELQLAQTAGKHLDKTFTFEYSTQKVDNLDSKIVEYNTFWDIYLRSDSKVSPSQHKDFIGIEVTSSKGFVADGHLVWNAVSGALLLDPTIPGTSNISLYATPFAPVPSPEPGTLVMLGTGLLGIGAAMSKRRGW